MESGAEVSGAWLLLAQVAALDPSAPSWEFLQVLALSPHARLSSRGISCSAMSTASYHALSTV